MPALSYNNFNLIAKGVTYNSQLSSASLFIIFFQTYCVDHNVADSACSGTAYLTGVKANSGTVGVSAGVKRGDCKAQKEGLYSVTGLMDWAQTAGKKTGSNLS